MGQNVKPDTSAITDSRKERNRAGRDPTGGDAVLAQARAEEHDDRERHQRQQPGQPSNRSANVREMSMFAVNRQPLSSSARSTSIVE